MQTGKLNRETKTLARRSVVMTQQLSNIYTLMARAGLFARGIVYGLVAALLFAAAVAPGGADEGYSPGDTFRRVETETGGQILLIMIGTGLWLYAFWRFMQAGFDTSDKGDDAGGIFARLGMASSGISYLLVGTAAFIVLFGENSGEGGGTTEQVARFALGQSFGQTLLALIGLVILAIGVVQCWRGLSRHWSNELSLPYDSQMICRGISFAIAGRGLLIMLIGVFLVWAGIAGDADEAKGLSAILGWLRQQPFGLWLYSIGALFIAGYGFYSLMETRFLKINFDPTDLPFIDDRKTVAT